MEKNYEPPSDKDSIWLIYQVDKGSQSLVTNPDKSPVVVSAKTWFGAREKACNETGIPIERLRLVVLDFSNDSLKWKKALKLKKDDPK
jgi:hypothetical protein